MDNNFRAGKKPPRHYAHLSVKATTPSQPALTGEADAARQAESNESEVPFRTPEEVAAAQDLEAVPDNLAMSLPGTAGREARKPAGKTWRQKLALHWPPGKKEWLVLAGVLVLAGISAGTFALTRHPAKPMARAQPTKKVSKVAVAPKTVPSTLSGLPVDPAVNQRPVTAVMIENSPDARPQAGLGQASVVFEAIAEGGITRFLALYQDTAPDNIGPVRSARPYYIEWVLGFDAAYAHVGGSPEALNDVRDWGVHDLDQFANGGSYHRISEREAPHNVYTSIASLNQLETAKGYTSSSFSGFARKPAATAAKPTTTKSPSSKSKSAKQPTTPATPALPSAKSIGLAISGSLYNVHYDYSAATNSYARSEGGAAHIDVNTTAQISPAVVIALVMPYGLQSDGHHSDYQTIGSGTAYVFQDGTVSIGQWTKANDKSQFTFTGSDGKPLLLNPGQTWLTALSNTAAISYSP